MSSKRLGPGNKSLTDLIEVTVVKEAVCFNVDNVAFVPDV
jgi:hypothetical protein